MMSVEEYALDTNNTVLAIIDMCKKLGINANSSSDMLSEDDIIILDNEIANMSGEDIYTDDEYVDDDELESDLRINTEAVNTNEAKMKKKQVIKKDDKSKYLKAKKAIYKNKEKLTSNKSLKDDSIILYKEGMTVKDVSDALSVSSSEVLKKLFNLGVMANINQSLDFATVEMIVVDYNKTLKKEETSMSLIFLFLVFHYIFLGIFYLFFLSSYT